MKHSIQLWSVRDRTEKDMLGTLETLAKIGYDGVELAGNGNATPEQIKEKCDEVGLVVSSAHISLDDIENDFDRVVSDNRIMGNKIIVVPYAPVECGADVAQNINRLQAACDKLIPLGFDVYYHNHEFEFKAFDGVVPEFEYINNLPDIKIQFDVFWTYMAGADAVKLLSDYKDRIGFTHLKDGTKTAHTALGDGDADINEIYRLLKSFNQDWCVAEIENSAEVFDSIEDAAKSFAFLKKCSED